MLNDFSPSLLLLVYEAQYCDKIDRVIEKVFIYSCVNNVIEANFAVHHDDPPTSNQVFHQMQLLAFHFLLHA